MTETIYIRDNDHLHEYCGNEMFVRLRTNETWKGQLLPDEAGFVLVTQKFPLFFDYRDVEKVWLVR